MGYAHLGTIAADVHGRREMIAAEWAWAKQATR